MRFDAAELQTVYCRVWLPGKRKFIHFQAVALLRLATLERTNKSSVHDEKLVVFVAVSHHDKL